MMAVPWERIRMLPWVSAFELARAAYRVAGIISDADATAIRDDMVDATVELKVCSWWRRPPTRKQQPSTSRMLERMLPSMLAWTTRISLSFKATMLTCYWQEYVLSTTIALHRYI